MLTIVGVATARLTLNDRVEQVLRDAAERAVRYLRDGRGSPGAPEGLDVPLPDKPTAPEDVLARLDEMAGPATVANGGPLPVALAAGWLAGAWDEPPATVARVALRWLAELLGLPAGTPGGLVANCAAANRAALAAARDRLLARDGWDVEARGLFGAPPVRVLVGGEPDPEFWKALVPLGFGREQVTRVRVDGQGRLRPTLIPPATGPTVVW